MKYYFLLALMILPLLCQSHPAPDKYHEQILAFETQRHTEVLSLHHALKEKQDNIDKLIRVKERNERTIYLIVALALILLLVEGLVLRYRCQTKSSAIIESQVRQIQEQADVLKNIAHKQSHDIRGPIATILGLAQLFNYDNPEDHNNRVVLKGIADVAEKLDMEIANIVKTQNEMNH
jgi:K+-sensing histidine kinase KdpD